MLVDCLHEDLNRVKIKGKYLEIESENKPDE